MVGMKLICVILLFLLCLLHLNDIHAQSGGPPMITDDPGIVEVGKWEINTSINTSFTQNTQLAVPYLDVNYGAAKNLQLKIEDPYLVTIDANKHISGNIGDPLIGVKYQFINEDKYFISVATYPQATVTGDQKGILIPLLLEKTFGRFVIGEDIGYFYVQNDSNNIQAGTLLGYKVCDRFEVMGEYFIEKSYSPTIAITGLMNYGFRYRFNKTFTLLGSFGTQVVTPADKQRQYFFSYLGVQSSF
jgi:hypothetical protein